MPRPTDFFQRKLILSAELRAEPVGLAFLCVSSGIIQIVRGFVYSILAMAFFVCHLAVADDLCTALWLFWSPGIVQSLWLVGTSR